MLTLSRTIPPETTAASIHVVGSWDGFRTPLALEQDQRVGRDVWKTVLSRDGGLEMGSEHVYYVSNDRSRQPKSTAMLTERQFLIDNKYPMPDPAGPHRVDNRTGRMVSILYVPVELAPTPERPRYSPPSTAVSRSTTTSYGSLLERTMSPSSVVGSSLFADFSDQGSSVDLTRQTSRKAMSIASSFRSRLKNRTMTGILGSSPPAKRRRSWGTGFLHRRGSADEMEIDAGGATEQDILDIAGYLRSDDGNANAAFSRTVSCQLPMPIHTIPESRPISYSSRLSESSPRSTSGHDFVADLPPELHAYFSYSSDDEMPETPPSASTRFPRFYNFDEVKGGGLKELGLLRDEVAGDVKWRDELVGELGYLGGVVV